LARAAIAATLTSVILLSVLVVADATVVTAQDNLAASSQLSRLEKRELLLEQSLAGSLSLDLLGQVQTALSSTPSECSSLQNSLRSVSAGSSSAGDDSGVAFLANATAGYYPESVGPMADNLTISGEVPGVLDLRETLSIREDGGGVVTLARRETHILNVPIHVDSALSLCVSTQGALGSALASSPCNATLDQAAFDATLPGLADQASAQGFALTAGWEPVGTCSASFWFRLVELGVSGATGSFDWTVIGSGTVG